MRPSQTLPCVCKRLDPWAVSKKSRCTFLIGTAAISGEGEITLKPYILINYDGITIIAPRAEMGQGVHTILAALVAEEMDVTWEDITVLHGPPAQAY